MKSALFTSAMLACIGFGVVGDGRGAIAYNGFYTPESFTSRVTTYDEYLPANTGTIDNSQMHTLWNHIAFPQSRSAMTGLLGYPTSWQGEWDYYRYNGSDVAIYYSGDTALFFTVGY
ncbi:MAG: hypothetical protein AAFQ63_12175 [Cyanobacteria bacterium J06621_11]